MTAEVFESVKNDLDDEFEIQNTLSIEVREHWVGDKQSNVVNVDTNYKATRPGQHPVNLTLVDALRAAAVLVQSVNEADFADDDDPGRAWELLRVLEVISGEVSELRRALLIDLKPKAE